VILGVDRERQRGLDHLAGEISLHETFVTLKTSGRRPPLYIGLDVHSRESSLCYEASCGYGHLYEALRLLALRVAVAHPAKLVPNCFLLLSDHPGEAFDSVATSSTPKHACVFTHLASAFLLTHCSVAGRRASC
jgi:hypothetical protein